jgi:hypothetical protein
MGLQWKGNISLVVEGFRAVWHQTTIFREKLTRTTSLAVQATFVEMPAWSKISLTWVRYHKWGKCQGLNQSKRCEGHANIVSEGNPI